MSPGSFILNILLLFLSLLYQNEPICVTEEIITSLNYRVKKEIINPIAQFDRVYEETFPYVKHTKTIKRLSHIANEKAIFTLYTQYQSNQSVEMDCSKSIENFFNNNKKNLFVGCNDDRRFSYCQESYIFRYLPETKKCSRFSRFNYTNNGFTGLTLVTQLSLDRLNRIPYILKRWEGKISLSLFVVESDMTKVDKALRPYLNDQITYVFYVVKDNKNPKFRAYYIKGDRKREWFNTPIFPLNMVRDLAIESIGTTHYLLIDIDFFISKTLYKNIYEYKDKLAKPDTVVLLPTFMTEKHRLKECRTNNTCESLWSKIPSTKSELVEARRRKEIVYIETGYHNVIQFSSWIKEKKNRLIPFKIDKKTLYEPYGIFRRSAYDPLFHPYYIIYGRDKIEFYERMKSKSVIKPECSLEYTYYVMSCDFGVDLPHRRSSSAIKFVKKRTKHYKGEPDLMIKQYYAFWESYKTYLD